MKIIVINSPKFGIKEVLVDDEDYDYLNQFNWFIQKLKQARNFYVVRNICRFKLLSMHRDITKITDRKIKVDHIDHNGTNNQKSNLRICTQRQNTLNSQSRIGSTSKFLGVSKHSKDYDRWVAVIHPNGVKIHLGVFPFTDEGEILAAQAYDKAAREHFGEFANLNFK